MKKRTLVYYLLTLLLTMLLAISAWRVYTNIRDKNNYNCSATFTMHNYGLKMPVILTLRINENRGVIFYDGPVYNNHDELLGLLSRQVEFTAKRNAHSFYLSNNVITKRKKDNVAQGDAEKIMPDFFVKSASEIYFDVRQGKEGTLFIKDNVPFFYCSPL